MDRGETGQDQGWFSGGPCLGKRFALRYLWSLRARKPLVFQIGQSAQRLIISASVLNHFTKHQQLDNGSLEAGGQLFARFLDEYVTISKVTGPRAADHRSRYSYVPNRREEQREINDMHRRGFHFVGDWHTHPEPVPTPSPSDISTINQAVAKSQHHLLGFIMVVVGNGSFPSSLHVSLNTATSHLQLLRTR
jgi:integrative and conjugative element protein (TIGR02256 family)